MKKSKWYTFSWLPAVGVAYCFWCLVRLAGGQTKLTRSLILSLEEQQKDHRKIQKWQEARGKKQRQRSLVVLSMAECAAGRQCVLATVVYFI